MHTQLATYFNNLKATSRFFNEQPMKALDRVILPNEEIKAIYASFGEVYAATNKELYWVHGGKVKTVPLEAITNIKQLPGQVKIKGVKTRLTLKHGSSLPTAKNTAAFDDFIKELRMAINEATS